MTDIIIIGGGPAGVSAALYTARAGLATKIIYKDSGALFTAEQVDNFYGNAGITGQALVTYGLAQAEAVGAEIISGEVVKIEQVYDGIGHFLVETVDSGFTSRALVLATGASRSVPKIPGILEYEGKGVSHCAVCDAFFYRGKDVAVLGHGEYALSEVKTLTPLVRSVTVLTNGREPEADFPSDVAVRKEVVKEVLGDTRLTGVTLELTDASHILHEVAATPSSDNAEATALQISGLFIAIGTAGATALARKIGALTDSNVVITDENMRTNIPGLWAAGDCTAGMKQITKAVYDGAKAGTDIVKFLRES